jgi:hypothetical protein
MKNFVLLVIALPSLLGALLGYLFVLSVSVSADGATDLEILAGMGIGALVAGLPGMLLCVGVILIEKVTGPPSE